MEQRGGARSPRRSAASRPVAVRDAAIGVFRWCEIAQSTVRPGVVIVILPGRQHGNANHKRITGQLMAAAPAFGVEIISATGREAADIETAMSQWGQGLGYGVIVPSDPATNSRRGLVVELAARYRLPTIYSLRSAVVDGGLMSYGVDIVELFRQAAIYANRIVKGEKPAELPVQLPTKFELIANLKTAKAQGFNIPPLLLATADEVIEAQGLRCCRATPLTLPPGAVDDFVPGRCHQHCSVRLQFIRRQLARLPRSTLQGVAAHLAPPVRSSIAWPLSCGLQTSQNAVRLIVRERTKQAATADRRRNSLSA